MPYGRRVEWETIWGLNFSRLFSRRSARRQTVPFAKFGISTSAFLVSTSTIRVVVMTACPCIVKKCWTLVRVFLGRANSCTVELFLGLHYDLLLWAMASNNPSIKTLVSIYLSSTPSHLKALFQRPSACSVDKLVNGCGKTHPVWVTFGDEVLLGVLVEQIICSLTVGSEGSFFEDYAI